MLYLLVSILLFGFVNQEDWQGKPQPDRTRYWTDIHTTAEMNTFFRVGYGWHLSFL
jgi:hypothetical protein